jgi:hypothetical protein
MLAIHLVQDWRSEGAAGRFQLDQSLQLTQRRVCWYETGTKRARNVQIQEFVQYQLVCGSSLFGRWRYKVEIVSAS